METTSTYDGQVIEGTADNDILTAANNNVTLNGGSGDDQLFSQSGTSNTIMDGGAGYDLLNGAGTNDTASYASAQAGVIVDLFVEEYGLGAASDDGNGTADALIGIENVIGSAFADTLIGDDLPNVLQGGAGNDTLKGEGGADVFKFNFTQGGGETFRFTDFFAAPGHGGSVVDGVVAEGTKQGQFSSLYTQWLESLGLTVLDLGQNSGPGGMPVVEGPDGTFGERESFTWSSGSKKPVVHERWYSDTWTSGSGGGQDAVTSNDGSDTIVNLDFVWGTDKLEFNGLAGLTLDQFTGFFTATEAYVNDDTVLDTTLALANGGWEVTLLGVSGHTVDAFYGSIS